MSSDPESADYSRSEPDSDSSNPEEKTLVSLKTRTGCCSCCPALCTASRFCHSCYIIQFCLYLLVFPLWAKWLIVSPMPVEHWHQAFAPFPMLEGDFNSEASLLRQSKSVIDMSAIPRSASQCNYSCSTWGGRQRSEEMNFDVQLTLNDSSLPEAGVHTVFPVLLASADFQDWWVAADKRFSSPPFWNAQTAHSGKIFTYETPKCTRAPGVDMGNSEMFTGAYILACVTWSPTSLGKLSKATSLTNGDIGQYCNHVGGVCGWGCGGSNIPNDRLQGCSAKGVIEVTSDSFAGNVLPPTAKFTGKVEMKQCSNPQSPAGTCITQEKRFSNWNCPRCQYDSTPIDDVRRLQIPGMEGIPGIEMPDSISGIESPGAAGDKTGPVIYTSLPKFQVELSGTDVPKGYDILSSPAIFVFQSSVATPGSWKPIYQEYVKTNPPVPLDASGIPITPKSSSEDSLTESETRPSEMAFSNHRMVLDAQNRINIEPEWCYAKQGPLYLVACAVNGSIYNSDSSFKGFKPGQKVAPPPFNDRCVDVSGRCATACSVEQASMANCTAGGFIPQEKLVGLVEAETNNLTAVWIFCYILLLAFTIKTVSMCPGIFSDYTHYRRYDTDLTRRVSFINVCIPTAGEAKAVMLRSFIGAVASMPKGCECYYDVTLADDGHFDKVKLMMECVFELADAIPGQKRFAPTGSMGSHMYKDLFREFFLAWVEDTKKMDINLLSVEDELPETADPAKWAERQETLDRLSGKTSLNNLLKNAWSYMDGRNGSAGAQAQLEPLRAAINNLREVVCAKDAAHHDLTQDSFVVWTSDEIKLRMHYVARAMPPEDERTVKSQHVAPGIYYYEMPVGADDSEWLRLRKKNQEMVYGLQKKEGVVNFVPLHTSRGQPGALNFSLNYMLWYSRYREKGASAELEDGSCLFSVCDPYHQFQPDFYHSTLPYFFDKYGDLDDEVAYSQCPQYYHEFQDKLDYLDSNNAQFFRFHGTIQSPCGGVSAWATNSTWLIQNKPQDKSGLGIWQEERTRVRGQGGARRKTQWVERKHFPESCKVQHMAKTMDETLAGRRSAFINRRLSYGMSKSGTDVLASMQRTAEGSVVLWLQFFFSLKGITLWLTLLAFFLFFVSLGWLVKTTSTDWVIVRIGLLPRSVMETVTKPLVSVVRSLVTLLSSHYFERGPHLLEHDVNMVVEFVMWVLGLAIALSLTLVLTECLKACGKCRCLSFVKVPDEMRHWSRLLIRAHQLSAWVWFWMPLFWVGFNYWNVFARQSYLFSPLGMFIFIVIIEVVSCGMVMSASMRGTLQASMETNEVLSLSMDSLWRAHQSFYIMAPVTFYSLIKGAEDYMLYHLYGQDITFSRGPERGKASIFLVKWWTLLLILGAVAAWVHYSMSPIDRSEQYATLTSCIIVTLIALDVLHPCAYLWVGQSKMTKEQAKQLSWCKAIFTPAWWERCLYRLVLNQTLSGFIKWLGPACFVALPFIIFVLPYMGVNLAFIMCMGTSNL
eukprot:TRINITY_DN4627_c0_g1_i1.p1 TRINITY_DN4627_c0_g1~~TRINITY_DN4627_c0_g1_i1.p1  ORF type:complete len:1494 (-),score=283.41 TRINITY_DN4627_c0_g1_i1:57-4538(-)